MLQKLVLIYVGYQLARSEGDLQINHCQFKHKLLTKIVT
jgi:hypothetical protein